MIAAASADPAGLGQLARSRTSSLNGETEPRLGMPSLSGCVIELSTRRVEIAGIAGISATANGLWISQIARNLTDSVDGLLMRKSYVIHDRDPLFTDEFL